MFSPESICAALKLSNDNFVLFFAQRRLEANYHINRDEVGRSGQSRRRYCEHKIWNAKQRFILLLILFVSYSGRFYNMLKIHNQCMD